MGIKSSPVRGDIYLVNLDPVVGHEISKTRPALIISNDINNNLSDTVTVLPVTSSVEKVFPFEVLIYAGVAGMHKNSKIKCNQIRTVDKMRLTKFIGKITPDILKATEKALRLHLGMY
jgi:mRNA interferase MazF